jgi:hypothetical protein
VKDLALYLSRVDGVIESRNHPPLMLYRWPLEPGQTWAQTYISERPAQRQTAETSLVCQTSEREEAVRVQAGTFGAWVVSCRNRRTDSPSFELWYAPEVRFIVRDRTYLPYGVRERELIQYRLR